MNPQEAAHLRGIAARYIWWESPEEALRRPVRVLAQVMDKGDFRDIVHLFSRLGPAPFREAIAVAEPGWFGPRAWHYWHYRLGIVLPGEEVPDLPRRTFGDAL
jgi:hypothetical protein